MRRKQLLLLFLAYLVPWTCGNGLMPLLPVYAVRLGASSAVAGYYLAFVFLALAIGSFLAGPLAEALRRRKPLLIASGAAMVPLIWLMGRARTILGLACTTAAVFFLFGVAAVLVTTIAGLLAAEKERGRVFGLLGVTMGLGGVIGGLSVGPLVDRWGYPAMFTVLGAFCLLLVACASLARDKEVPRQAKHVEAGRRAPAALGGAFIMLVLAQLVSLTVNGTGNIGRSLAMNDLGFSATALSSTSVIGGLIMLPLPFFLGWLSDRLGRRLLMIVCYASLAACAVVFAAAASLWHFWLGTTLLGVGMISNSVGAAYVADLLPPQSLGKGVSLFQGAHWLGNVVGLAAAGYAFQNVGIRPVMLAAAALPAIGMVLLFSSHRTGRRKGVVPLPG